MRSHPSLVLVLVDGGAGDAGGLEGARLVKMYDDFLNVLKVVILHANRGGHREQRPVRMGNAIGGGVRRMDLPTSFEEYVAPFDDGRFCP